MVYVLIGIEILIQYENWVYIHNFEFRALIELRIA